MAKQRREYGTGGIFQYRNSTKWTIQFRTLDGRCVREATGTTSRQQAQQLLVQRLAAVGRGEPLERLKPYTVRQLWETMVGTYHTDQRSRAVRDFGTRWLHLGPVFENMAATMVNTDTLNSYVQQRRQEGAASATINKELAGLRRAMNMAYQATPPRLQRVPKFPHLEENNTRKGFVTVEQFEKLCAAADSVWMRTFLELAFTYGWRLGEMTDLRVRNVCFAEGEIRLDAGSTKNKDGRVVEMTPLVRTLLEQCCMDKKPNDHVITRVTLRKGTGNRQMPIRDIRDAWCALCQRAGVSTALLRHDMRRSMAKAARAAGVPEGIIMRAGGWRTRSMFERYAIQDKAEGRRFATAMATARTRPTPITQISGPLVGAEPETDLASMPVKGTKPA
jgi:integrase